MGKAIRSISSGELRNTRRGSSGLKASGVRQQSDQGAGFRAAAGANRLSVAGRASSLSTVALRSGSRRAKDGAHHFAVTTTVGH
jgi:hypothetical protein